MLERRKLNQHKIDVKLQLENTQEDCEALQNESKQYTLSKFWNGTTQVRAIQDLYAQCMFLLELPMFPFSVSCVKRIFSRTKLVTTRLQNQLSQVLLESLLRISTELLFVIYVLLRFPDNHNYILLCF